MSAHSLEDFYRSLKGGKLSPAYYFWGSEDVLKEEALGDIIELALDPGSRDFNLDLVSPSQTGPDEIADLCATLPMMAEKRVVVVKGVEAWKRKTKAKKALSQYLANPMPDTVLVLVQGGSEQKADKAFSNATAVEFRELAPDKLTRWLIREAKSQKVEFAPGATEHLLAVMGADLAGLRSEVSKVGALAPTEPVSAELIGDLIGVRHGETIFDWRNAVLSGQTGMALDLTGPVLMQSGVTGVKLVTTLGTGLVGIGLARAFIDQGRSGRSLEQAVFNSLRSRVRPFGLSSWNEEARRWANWAPNWPRPRLKAALADTPRADQLLKSTRLSDDQSIMSDLVMRVGGVPV